MTPRARDVCAIAAAIAVSVCGGPTAPASKAAERAPALVHLPPADTFDRAADPPRLHPALVVGARTFVLPKEKSARRPSAVLGEPSAQALIGHGIAGPLHIVDPKTAAEPTPFTLAGERSACVAPGKQSWLVGIAVPNAEPSDAVDWYDAVELEGCASSTKSEVAGVFWTEIVLEGEHPEARYLQPRWPEGAAAAPALRWLSRDLAGDSNPYRVVHESAAEASLITIPGLDLWMFKTSVPSTVQTEPFAVSLLRVVRGGRVLGTFRNAGVMAAILTPKRAFLLVDLDDVGETRLYEVTRDALLDGGVFLTRDSGREGGNP